MSVGWIVVAVFSKQHISYRSVSADDFEAFIVGLGMAEIVSAIPTSGGPYFWSAMLAPKGHAPFASWVTGWYVKSIPVCYPGTLLHFSIAVGLSCLTSMSGSTSSAK